MSMLAVATAACDFLGHLQTFFNDLKSLPSVSGLNSAIYSALTASFVLAGLTYIGLPSQTLTAVFGTAAEKGLEDIFLWQLIGTAVSMVVAPIAYTQKVCAHAIHSSRVCNQCANHSIVRRLEVLRVYIACLCRSCATLERDSALMLMSLCNAHLLALGMAPSMLCYVEAYMTSMVQGVLAKAGLWPKHYNTAVTLYHSTTHSFSIVSAVLCCRKRPIKTTFLTLPRGH